MKDLWSIANKPLFPNLNRQFKRMKDLRIVKPICYDPLAYEYWSHSPKIRVFEGVVTDANQIKTPIEYFIDVIIQFTLYCDFWIPRL